MCVWGGGGGGGSTGGLYIVIRIRTPSTTLMVVRSIPSSAGVFLSKVFAVG